MLSMYKIAKSELGPPIYTRILHKILILIVLILLKSRSKKISFNDRCYLKSTYTRMTKRTVKPLYYILLYSVLYALELNPMCKTVKM